MTSRHDPDCDGYRLEHRCTVERIPHAQGRHATIWTYRAVCETCGPIHPGAFGEAVGARYVERLAGGHAVEVPCDGRCLAWSDPEYADVDEAGQLALGVAGEQRAIPGLARARTTHEED